MLSYHGNLWFLPVIIFAAKPSGFSMWPAGSSSQSLSSVSAASGNFLLERERKTANKTAIALPESHKSLHFIDLFQIHPVIGQFAMSFFTYPCDPFAICKILFLALKSISDILPRWNSFPTSIWSKVHQNSSLMPLRFIWNMKKVWKNNRNRKYPLEWLFKQLLSKFPLDTLPPFVPCGCPDKIATALGSCKSRSRTSKTGT